MEIYLTFCFIIFICLNLSVGRYIVQNEFVAFLQPTEWVDQITGKVLDVCQKNTNTFVIGKQQSLTNIYWKKTYSLPASTCLDIYIEFQISGIWNNDKLEVYANNILMQSLTITLNDQNRDCKTKQQLSSYQSFLYESKMYLTFKSYINTLQLTFRSYTINQGLYVQNIVINQKTEYGRNHIIPFFDYIKTCTQGSGLEFIQYYCQCTNSKVFQNNKCQSQCDQNYLYDPQTNDCYYKSNCQTCSGKNTILQCSDGMFKYQETTASISNCVQKCPQDYYEDRTTMTCINMQMYLQQNENKGSIFYIQLDIVDHYFFYKSTADFFHFFQYNDFVIQAKSNPSKFKERSFIYHDGSFAVGSYETFQSQKIQLFVILKNSQYKLRFRAIGHFIDFYPSSNDVIINGISQSPSSVILSTKNEQKNDADYIAYYDYYWTRTELHPNSYSTITFFIEQPLQNGVYQGYFYLEDIHIFSFRCVTGCKSCFTIDYCSPCLNPANKNPSYCTCLTGYVMKQDICIGCPTYCTYCTIEGICDDCQVITKRLNPPSCNICPSQYYVQTDQDNCQQCIIGCKICQNNTQCINCLQGYYKNIDKKCIIQCIDGYFNDNTDQNNPICSLCSNNCLKCQNTATYCIDCTEYATLINNHCYSCSDGYYLSNTSCLPCISNCQQCQGSICLKCYESYYFQQTIGQCVSICESNYYSSIATRTCEICDSSCLTCLSNTANDCLSCPKGKILNLQNTINGICQLNCLAGYFRIDDQCFKCWKGCASCIDTSQACLTCAPKYYRHKLNDLCYEQCPDGFYNNKIGFICSNCDPICKTCNGVKDTNCTSCILPLGYFQNQCIKKCPEGYGNVNAICIQCTPNCKQCFGMAPNECAVCSQGFFFLKSQCYYKCPTSFFGVRPQYVCKCIYDNCVACTALQFFYNNHCYDVCPQGSFGFNGLCIQCSLACETCFGEDEQSCLTCQPPLILFQNTCVTECTGMTFHDIIKNECLYCDFSCLACNGPNKNNCTACKEIKFLTGDGTCVDECSNNEYAVLLEKKCYKCDSSCLTCFSGSKNSCLTCNNLFYLYQCVDTCPDGFTVSDNKLSCEPNFTIVITQCAYQCQTCELVPRFCNTCSGNRIQNPPNCDCENGYFDDGQNFNCLQCLNKCSTCSHSPDACITCKGNRFLPKCNCPKFYYDDGFSVDCQRCEDNCATCTATQCITCLNNRINVPDCICPDGYFEAYQPYCMQCAQKCLTCSMSEGLCSTCSTIRVNPPICNCPVGYFENSDEECDKCNPGCIECDISGCLSCFGNRVGPIKGQCICQTPGVSRLSVGSLYCTDCSLGVPYFGLNDQFNSFYFDFGGQIKIIADQTSDLCSLIFEKETLDKLGHHPQCSSDFIVIFGDNPNIQVGDLLYMMPQFFLFGCNNQFSNVIGMPLSIPSKIDPASHKPILKFKELISPSVCTTITIEFAEKLYNGNQQFKVISWDIILPNTPEVVIQQILQSNVANSSEVIIFPIKTFEAKTLYKFGITVESFAHLKNTITIEFIPQAYSTIIFKAKNTINQFHRYESIAIPFSISYYNCIEAVPPTQNLYYSISLQNTTLMKDQIAEGLRDGESIDLLLEFPPYYFSQYNSQTLVLTTKLSRADYSANTKDEFQIFIISSIPTLIIEGGNRMIGYDTNLKLNAKIKDPDLNEKEAEENNQNCNWSCTDIINGTNCQNQFHRNIEFDQNCSQFIKSKTFAPYEVFIFTVTIYKNLIPYSTRITIQTVEINLPILNVIGANEQQELNYYDEVIYQMIYPGANPDLLMYAGTVIYDSVVMATFQLFYLDIKFKLQNYFTNLTKQYGNKARLRLSVYDPRFILPSINTQILFMNIPPQECELHYIDKPDFVEFLDNLNITVINCQDDNLPLLYSVQLYPNQSIYQSNLIQANFYHYLLIIPPQQSNNLIFTLPYLNKVQHLILILIEDSKGGIVNITTQINVKQYENINQDTFQNYLNKQINLNQQLIAYRIIAERLQNVQNINGFQDRLFNKLLLLDQNQSLLSNQTESLYHSISILAGQNISILQAYDTSLLIQLNIRISFAQKMIENFRKEQENHQLSSLNNIQRNYYLQQYYTFANILSSLIKYRVFYNKSAIDLQDNLIQIITILQNNSIPNQPLIMISTDSVNLNFGYLTSKLTESVSGGAISDNKKFDDFFGDNLDYNSSTKYYKYSQTRYLDNPYYTTSGFPKNSSGYQAVDPKIVEQNQSSNINLSQQMTFAFPNIKELAKNTSIECIAQVDSTHWSAGICKTKQNKDQIICECENLNPTSVMESLDYILDKANQLYSLDTLLQFGAFPFYKTFIFYFYLFITGSYLSAVYWGMKVDEIMYQKIKNQVETVSIAQTEKGNHSGGDAQNAPQEEIIFKRTIFKSTNTKITNFLNYKKGQQNIGIDQYGRQSIENSAREIISVRGQIEEIDQEPHQIQSMFATSPKIFIADDKQVQDSSPESKNQSPNDIKKNNLPKISKLKAYFEYLKFFHQILQVFYKDDEQKPRALRATIVYTSIMGSLTVLFVFNQPGNLSLTITLALITAPLNKIYQIILEKLLTHQKKVVRSFGGLSIIIFIGMISYTMLAGLMLSGSVDAANQWSIIFISQFSLDNLLYSPMQLVLQYCVHVGLIHFPQLQQLLHKFLDEKGKQFLKEIFTKTGLI